MEINSKIADLVRSKKTQLPTLPVVVDNILKLANNDNTSIKDLAEFIGKDQAISNKILKIANSAYYGFVNNVDTVNRAIIIIGLNEVIGVTIGMSVFKTFSKNGGDNVLDMQALWVHSIACALTAKELAKKAKMVEAEEIFLNGLLHDTGKVIFAVYFPEEYRSVLDNAVQSQKPLHIAEREKLGLDHATLSGLLMERWHFPESLLLPSRFHHNVAKCPNSYQTRAMMVQLANFLCQKASIGHSGNPVNSKVEKMSQKMGISLKDVETVFKDLKKKRAEIEEFVKVIN